MKNFSLIGLTIIFGIFGFHSYAQNNRGKSSFNTEILTNTLVSTTPGEVALASTTIREAKLLLNAQDTIPVIKSNISQISIRDGANFKKNNWTLSPDAKPDVYNAELINGKSHKVTFITDIDSISFMVEEGKTYDFIVVWDEKICLQQIQGHRFVPAAVFDDTYQSNRRGKTVIQIPKVYELINIAMAITSFGIERKNYFYQNSSYYSEVRIWFDQYNNHSLILKLDTVLKKNPSLYSTLKMNGNAFEINENGRIVRSAVFDRTGYGYERTNTLLPYMDLLQSFADESNFLKFYENNEQMYKDQIAFYKDSANIDEMKNWLDNNFPGSNSYDAYNIIFSPLVSRRQSTTWFESNGFRELQPHVNFPYPQDLESLFPLSQAAEFIYRGNIVFTEINHGYINPETDKYADRISKAVSNRDLWVTKGISSNYYAGHAVFTEYMNWGLISLRIVDYVPKHEQDKLIASIVRKMVKNRDFIKFEEFNTFLIDLYLGRKATSTIADLYPQIIGWFEKNN
jgi:hypothetical protein